MLRTRCAQAITGELAVREEALAMQGHALTCADAQNGKVAEEGLEPIAKTTGISGDSATGDAESDANDAELRQIATDLRRRLSAGDRKQLAAILLAD